MAVRGVTCSSRSGGRARRKSSGTSPLRPDPSAWAQRRPSPAPRLALGGAPVAALLVVPPSPRSPSSGRRRAARFDGATPQPSAWPRPRAARSSIRVPRCVRPAPAPERAAARAKQRSRRPLRRCARRQGARLASAPVTPVAWHSIVPGGPKRPPRPPCPPTARATRGRRPAWHACCQLRNRRAGPEEGPSRRLLRSQHPARQAPHAQRRAPWGAPGRLRLAAPQLRWGPVRREERRTRLAYLGAPQKGAAWQRTRPSRRTPRPVRHLAAARPAPATPALRAALRARSARGACGLRPGCPWGPGRRRRVKDACGAASRSRFAPSLTRPQHPGRVS